MRYRNRKDDGRAKYRFEFGEGGGEEFSLFFIGSAKSTIAVSEAHDHFLYLWL